MLLIWEVFCFKIDYLLPNENELDLLLEDKSLKRDEKIKKLLALGVKKIILTRGKNGVTLYTNNKVKEIKAPEVNVVDTTAAGDAFAGSLAYGLNKRWQEEEVIKFAILVASFSVTRLGAQSSLPNMKEI